MDMNEKRKKMLDLLYDVLNIMDKTEGKQNLEKYRAMFDTMNMKEFTDFFDNFFNSKQQFVFEFVPYDGETTIADAVTASKVIGFPMLQKIALTHLAEGYASAYDCMIIPIHVKRVQQMVNKKNSMSIESNERDPKTGYSTIASPYRNIWLKTA